MDRTVRKSWVKRLREAGVSEWIITRIYDRYGHLAATPLFDNFIEKLCKDDQKYGIGNLTLGKSKASSDHDIASLCFELGFPVASIAEISARFAADQAKIGLVSAAIAAVTPAVIPVGVGGGIVILLYHYLFN